MDSYRGYARGAHGQVHFKVAGTANGSGAAQGARLPLVLCHQSPSSLRQFDAVYGPLAAAGYRSIGIDNPGFGYSDAPQAPPTIEDFADAVLAVLDELGVARAHILGQHTGSMVAMEATIRHPTRFGKLILNTPTPFNAEERSQWLDTLIARQKAWKVTADGRHLIEMWERRLRATPGWTDLSAMHRYVLQMLLAGDTLWYGHHASLVYDQLSRLNLIRRPCLVLNNTGDFFELASRALQVRPDFALAVLEGGTHDIQDEQPHAWTDAVIQFLNDTSYHEPAAC